MHSPDVVRIITAIRTSHPDMEELYRRGQCYNFFLILKSIFPTAEAYYSPFEGHVYTRIFGYYYDIRGVHLVVPIDLEILDHRRGDPPHRWGERDLRRLIVVQRVDEGFAKRQSDAARELTRRRKISWILRIITIGVGAIFIYFTSLKTK